MRSINKVILIGNLTRDPETRQTPNGQFVCTFGIATNRVWVTSDGGHQNSTEFHELVAWAKLAEICQKNLRKGKLIYVEGYLKTRSWDNPEGIKKFKTEIIIQDLIILEKRPREEKNGNSPDEFVPEETAPVNNHHSENHAEKSHKVAKAALPHHSANPSADEKKGLDIDIESDLEI